MTETMIAQQASEYLQWREKRQRWFIRHMESASAVTREQMEAVMADHGFQASNAAWLGVNPEPHTA